VSEGWRIGEKQFFCPICNYHKPRLTINFDKEAYFCWHCKTDGAKYPGGSLRKLFKRLDIPEQDKQIAISRLSRVPARLMQDNTPKWLPHDLGAELKNTVPATMATNQDALAFLDKKGITQVHIEEYAIRYDQADHRLLLPEPGNLLSNNGQRRVGTIHVRAFGKNYREKAYRLSSLSSQIMHEQLLPKGPASIIMVEGPWDAIRWQIAIIKAGIDNTVVIPLYGLFFVKSLTDLLWKRRRSKIVDKILIAADKDNRGIYGAHKLVRQLFHHVFSRVSIASFDSWERHNPAEHTDEQLRDMTSAFQTVSSTQHAQFLLERFVQP
tara:strand:- start:2310 stop:3281 length:972 start_codon:yes stop_codon:yes gene_type:complete